MAEQLVGLDFLKKNEIKNKTCDMKRPFVFISYSHDAHDTQIVRNVFNLLYSRGYNLWIDTANMPHDENAWTRSALNALRNHNCAFAFFFRSESSMAKSTIAKELETIKKLRHVGDIVTVDIWHEENNTAEHVYDELLNDVEDAESFDACERICNIVNIANSAIRLATDAQNDVKRLAGAMEEELQSRNVHPKDVDDEEEKRKEREEKERKEKGEKEKEKGKETTDEGDEEGTDPVPGQKTIALPDFLAKYNNSNFKKDTFQSMRLVGAGEYARFSTEFYDSVYPVVWDFVMKILEERGEDYIHFVNGENVKMKNPPFITTQEHQRRKAQNSPITYRSLELPGLEGYSMCRHYGQYGWVSDVLCKRIRELGMPQKAFSFEYFEREGTVKPGVSSTGIRGPVTLIGDPPRKRRRAVAADGYDFDLFGQPFRGQPLNKMMLTVFCRLLESHPDKLDLLLDKLPCLGEGIEIGPDARPTTFRMGTTIEIEGRSISIGTSLGSAQVKGYMKRLMQLCGEPADGLIIYNNNNED